MVHVLGEHTHLESIHRVHLQGQTVTLHTISAAHRRDSPGAVRIVNGKKGSVLIKIILTAIILTAIILTAIILTAIILTAIILTAIILTAIILTAIILKTQETRRLLAVSESCPSE